VDLPPTSTGGICRDATIGVRFGSDQLQRQQPYARAGRSHSLPAASAYAALAAGE